MAPTDLLPGLGKMLEQRLGRTGYHIGTVVALAAAMSIILSPVLFGALAINAFHGSVNVNIFVLIVGLVLAAVMFACVFSFIDWIRNRSKRAEFSATVVVNKRRE